MRVSIDDVKRAINQVYQCELADVIEHIVYFRMCFGDYHCAVYLGLFEKYPKEPNASEQSLEVTFIPVDEEGDNLKYQGRSYTDVVLFANELQRALDWYAVTVIKDPEDAILVSFGYRVNTSEYDLAETSENNRESELSTAMCKLHDEFQLVAPIIRNFASGKGSIEQVKLLLAEPANVLLS